MPSLLAGALYSPSQRDTRASRHETSKLALGCTKAFSSQGALDGQASRMHIRLWPQLSGLYQATSALVGQQIKQGVRSFSSLPTLRHSSGIYPSSLPASCPRRRHPWVTCVTVPSSLTWTLSLSGIKSLVTIMPGWMTRDCCGSSVLQNA
jgi:hypothetical protein